jgi:hypothetical protein
VAVGLHTGGLSFPDQTVALNVVQHLMRIRQGCLAHTTQSLARGACLVLLVRSNIERDEEEQIRRKSDDAGKSGKLLTRALSGVRQPLEVRRSKVGPGGEVYETLMVSALSTIVCPGSHVVFDLPRSMTNWMIWRRVIHSFHQILMPRALWK